MRTYILLISLLFFSSVTLAKAQSHFAPLGKLPVNYFDTGAVCEQVAKEELKKTFPEATHDVVTGIAYGHAAATVGELDAVVFHKATQKAVLVAEVKCWNRLDRAYRKAMDQRKRFIRTLASIPHKILFYSKTQKYAAEQFSDVQQFIAISQAGGEAFGFEMTIPYTLEDLMSLRDQLLQCQQQKLCATP